MLFKYTSGVRCCSGKPQDDTHTNALVLDSWLKAFGTTTKYTFSPYIPLHSQQKKSNIFMKCSFCCTDNSGKTFAKYGEENHKTLDHT